MHIAESPPSGPSSSGALRMPNGSGSQSIGNLFTQVGTSAIAMFESLVSGAVAGATAKTVIAPGDRVKIIYQVDPNRPFSLRNAWRTGAKIVEHGGVLNLWRGNGATMMRVIPSASITFMSFEHYHNLFDYLLKQDYQRLVFGGPTSDGPSSTATLGHGASVLSRFCAGSMAGVTATTATYPLDMLRARYAAHNDPIHPRYPSYVQAIKEITAVEGWRSLYSGLRPTLVGIVPYAGINFAVFGTIKARIMSQQDFKSEREIPTYQRLVAGAFSGLVAQSLTYPLDIVRRRMQVSTAKYLSLGIRGTMAMIYRTEGTAGLFKGLTMNWIKGPISVAITFTMNDLVKTRIKDYNRAASYVERSSDGDLTSDANVHIRPATFAERLLCGAVAGGLAKLWTAPFDRIKIMYNVGLQTCETRAGYKQVLQQVREMLQESRGSMWQGSGAMLMRVVPYAGITYATYVPMKRFGQRITYSTEESILSNSIAGALSASIATVLLHPFDLIRVRSATHTTGGRRYLSYRSGLITMISQGGFRSLFEGLGPALAGIAPMAGISFALYEWLKAYAAPREKLAPPAISGEASKVKEEFMITAAETRGPLPFWKLWVMGCVAGCVASAASYPLNIVRRKAMVDQVVHSGIIANLRDMYTSKGFYAGLYGRLPLGWVMGTMTVGFSFSINDQLLYWVLFARAQLHEMGLWTSQPLWFAMLPDDYDDSAAEHNSEKP